MRPQWKVAQGHDRDSGNALTRVMQGTSIVAECYGMESKTNAQLMATAPELLEFTRLVLRGLKSGNVKVKLITDFDGDAEQLDMRSLADIASEVIAKAEAV